MGDIPSFPVDDATLAAVEHALDACLSMDEEHGGSPGNPVIIGADYSLDTLLDFLSGTTDDDDPRVYRIDGDGERMDPVDAARDDALGVGQWWVDERPHYTDRDVIRALIHEVRRLRGDRDVRPA
jgi:hypothetical protein